VCFINHDWNCDIYGILYFMAIWMILALDLTAKELNLLRERFYWHVTKTDLCWLYHGSMREGYGRLYVKRKWISAHILAYELDYGPIPIGKQLNHKCNTENCVRIDEQHVYVGTAKENTTDARIANKGWWYPRGKFSKEEIKKIRSIYIAGHRQYGVLPLSRLYNVSESTMFNIVKNRSWLF